MLFWNCIILKETHTSLWLPLTTLGIKTNIYCNKHRIIIYNKYSTWGSTARLYMYFIPYWVAEPIVVVRHILRRIRRGVRVGWYCYYIRTTIAQEGSLIRSLLIHLVCLNVPLFRLTCLCTPKSSQTFGAIITFTTTSVHNRKRGLNTRRECTLGPKHCHLIE